MPIGIKRKAQLVALRKENKKRKQEKTIADAIAAAADAIAAAQAQELAVEVLTNFASIEEELASTPVDFDISAMVAQYNLDQGLRSGPSQP